MNGVQAIGVALAAMWLLVGCWTPATSRPANETFATGTWYPYAKQGPLKPDEQRALDAVKRFEAKILRRMTVDYHYQIKRRASEYTVVIWYGTDFVNGMPKLTPDFLATYWVNDRFEVRDRSGGLAR